MKYILVEQNVVSFNNDEDIQVDASELANNGVAVVAYTGNSYWFERNPFNGREQDDNIKAIADEILSYAETVRNNANQATDAEKLASEREMMRVSAFQAKAALMQNGYYVQIVEYMNSSADEVTKLAWDTAQEFRRNSPTVNFIATKLELTETELDDLFRLAKTIEA